jgi:hypothetical protein
VRPDHFPWVGGLPSRQESKQKDIHQFMHYGLADFFFTAILLFFFDLRCLIHIVIAHENHVLMKELLALLTEDANTKDEKRISIWLFVSLSLHNSKVVLKTAMYRVYFRTRSGLYEFDTIICVWSELA